MQQIQIDLTNERLFNDLVEYTKLPEDLVKLRIKYAAAELACQWYNKKSIEDYYKTSDLFIYDLTRYQINLKIDFDRIQHMVQQIKKYGEGRILEFGGGIGEFSLVCDENALPVTYYDVESKTKNYALWRFNKYKAQRVVVNDDADYLLSQKWDFINIMDVLEHLEDANKVINKLKENTNYVFTNPNEIKFNIYFPQHIFNYKSYFEQFFEYVDGYLWKNKSLD